MAAASINVQVRVTLRARTRFALWLFERGFWRAAQWVIPRSAEALARVEVLP